MSALLTLTALPLAVALSSPDTVACWRVYVGSYAHGDEKGIHLLEFYPETGQLSLVGRAVEAESPSFLTLHPSQPILYAVGESVQPEGIVSAYRIDAKDGSLRLINQQLSKGTAPCHLVVAPSEKHLALANYSSGTVALFPILENGGLAEATSVIQHHGSSVNPQRQKGPHAHSVNFDAAGEHLYAADLGTDKMVIYQYDPDQGTLTPNEPPFVSLAPGAGPRHLTFHPSGHHAYVVNELDSTVTAFNLDPKTGALNTIGSVSTLPDDYDGESTTAEIRVHPTGKFLYASNRGHDSIAVFALDPSTGMPKPIGRTPTGGKIPRNFNLDPAGRYLLAANQESDNVVVFRIDIENGLLTPTGQSLSVPKPVCVVFSPAPQSRQES
jgi:6-phosphogluconolactonase